MNLIAINSLEFTKQRIEREILNYEKDIKLRKELLYSSNVELERRKLELSDINEVLDIYKGCIDNEL